MNAFIPVGPHGLQKLPPLAGAAGEIDADAGRLPDCMPRACALGFGGAGCCVAAPVAAAAPPAIIAPCISVLRSRTPSIVAFQSKNGNNVIFYCRQ